MQEQLKLKVSTEVVELEGIGSRLDLYLGLKRLARLRPGASGQDAEQWYLGPRPMGTTEAEVAESVLVYFGYLSGEEL